LGSYPGPRLALAVGLFLGVFESPKESPSRIDDSEISPCESELNSNTGLSCGQRSYCQKCQRRRPQHPQHHIVVLSNRERKESSVGTRLLLQKVNNSTLFSDSGPQNGRPITSVNSFLVMSFSVTQSPTTPPPKTELRFSSSPTIASNNILDSTC
jgi:hypothetical protein